MKNLISNTETKYKRFEILVRIFAFFVLALAIALCILLLSAKSGELQLLYVIFILVVTFAIIPIIPRIIKKRTSYLLALQDERNEIVYTGLFKDIYEACRNDEFTCNLINDELQFTECHNNTIDIGIIKNGHEFNIAIDENAVFIIVDEESESPVEAEFKLADIASMEQLYLIINVFIDEHSC